MVITENDPITDTHEHSGADSMKYDVNCMVADRMEAVKIMI